MKCLEGELCETKFEWPALSDQTNEKEMIVKAKTDLKKNGVCYINGSYFKKYILLIKLI